ncbi:MAG: molybdopterin synthase sulfur carrier subunit [Gammaproteobacteria bacterium]|nr:molybdopterin synthase sulfur carrier subunit [Gammaproteobacteria bacterium]
MSVKVLFDASLQGIVDCNGATVEVGEVAMVADIWLQASGGKPCPLQLQVACNGEAVELGAEVRSGDQLRFTLG